MRLPQRSGFSAFGLPVVLSARRISILICDSRRTPPSAATIRAASWRCWPHRSRVPTRAGSRAPRTLSANTCGYSRRPCVRALKTSLSCLVRQVLRGVRQWMHLLPHLLDRRGPVTSFHASPWDRETLHTRKPRICILTASHGI